MPAIPDPNNLGAGLFARAAAGIEGYEARCAGDLEPVEMHVTALIYPILPILGRARASGSLGPRGHVAPAVSAGLRVRVDRDTEARFRLGERAAFLAVYEAHGGAVRALVSRYFSSPFEREEAVQEAWLQVHRVAASFDAERGELLPWLRTIAANRCKELLRARGRRPDARVELADDALDARPSPEDEARDARVRAAVTRFEARLSEDEAKVFRLSLVEERTHDETARAAGVSVRRCKYLRMKLLLRVAADPALRAALAEVTGP
jgi:RNA polymerase sigma-70 factor (ECF subfamily)